MRWFGLFILFVAPLTVDAETSPDVVLITIDDLRPMLGCYGDTRIISPHIDSLARRGVVFERAYCQYAKCGTSRLSLMTGLRPDAVGVFSNNKDDVNDFRAAQPHIQSFARWLKDHGYHTQSFGKIYHDQWDVASDWSVPSQPGRPREMWEVAARHAHQRNKTHQGRTIDTEQPTIIADRWDCPVMQSPDVADDHFFAGRMTGKVIDAWRNQATEIPTFYAIGYRRPHLPFVAPKRYHDLYTVDDTWLATNPFPSPQAPVVAWFNSDGYVGGAKKIGLTMPRRPNRQQAIDWNGYEMRSYVGVPNHGSIDPQLQKELIHAYAACISYIDAQVGRLLDELERQKRIDNTIIILCSDHGWHLGEQSAWGKMTNYEIATRVPLIIAGEQIQPSRTRSLAELVDLYPTICDLTEIEKPAHLQGESLVAALRNPDAMTQSIATSQYSRYNDQYMGYAIRTDQFRYIRWVDQSKQTVVARELYDHHVDPDETNNLAVADPSPHDDVITLLDAQLDLQLDATH